MAGVAFQRMVSLVNRTTKPVDAMFNGQPVVIPPGYKLAEDEKIVGAGRDGAPLSFSVPYFAAEMCKRQNPVMGTEDPTNPAEFESLLGVIEWNDPIDHIEQSDAPERLDRELLDEEAQEAKPIKTAAGRRMAKLKKRGKGGRAFSDTRLKAPMGTKAAYDN